MIELIVLRHGPTRWNALGRIQGQRDIPLSEAGRARVLSWRLPPDATAGGRRWYVSPLLRTRETARLLGFDAATPEPALMEAAWGAWEGETLADLRARLGPAMAENEARGLDFRPPGGESPRDLQARLRGFLRRLATEGRPAGALAHRGIIRVLQAEATGWDMRGKPPEKLRNDGLHRFTVSAEGRVTAARLNQPLLP